VGRPLGQGGRHAFPGRRSLMARRAKAVPVTTNGDFEWWRRRVAIAGVLIFCALGVGYLIVLGKDTLLHRDIANGLILLAGSTLGSYVFGAVWDDSSKRKAIVDATDIAVAAGVAPDAALATATTSVIPESATQ